MSATRIAFRNLSRRKLRNALTILSIIIGVALLTGVNVAFDSAYNQFVDTINRSSGSVDISIRSATGASLSDDILPEILQVKGIAEASGRVTGSGHAIFWNATEESSALLTINGVNPINDFDYLNPEYTNITGKKMLSAGQIVIDSRLNYTIGQKIKVRIKSTYYWLEVAGLYHLPVETQGMSFLDIYTSYVTIPTAREMFKNWGKYSRIIARVNNVSNTKEVVSRLQNTLGGEYEIIAEKERILDRMRDALEGFRSGLFIMSALTSVVALVIVFNTVYMNVKERIYEIGVIRSIGASKIQVFRIFLFESVLLGVIGTIIGLTIGFMLAGQLSGMFGFPSSSEEVRMIYKPGTVILGVATGLFTTLIGGLIPSIMAGRTEILQALRPSMRATTHRRLHWILLGVGIPFFLIGTYLGRIVNATTTTDIPRIGVASIIPLIGGLILITAGLIRGAEKIFEYILYPIFGKISRLTSRNFSRNLVRTTVCFTLIAMSLSFIVVIAGVQFTVDDAMRETITTLFQSDIIVVTGDASIDREFWKDLVNLENGTLIEMASPARIIGTKVRTLTRSENVSISLTAIHTPNGAYSDEFCSYPEVMDMTFTPDTPQDVYQRLHDLNTIVLSSNVAQTLEAKVGSRINVLSLLAVEIAPGVVIWKPVWRNFKVVGIVEVGMDQMPMGGQRSKMCYISYHTLNGQWGYFEDEANLFYVKAKPEHSDNLAYVRDRILQRFGKKYGVGVITRIDILEAVKEHMSEMWNLFNNLILFSVAVAAIGMSSIMIMNISERRREIGVLRSQGMSMIQVGKMVVGEAVILGVIGFLLGTTSGMFFYRSVVFVMAEIGLSGALTTPWEAIRTAAILSLGVSALSVLYPLYKAIKLNIVDAVRRNE
ncbi:MAG: ABC transporter permease [Candidatus Bathyarchaeota archaeon]|nr:MAG: ABC transporter permease [Candidatus Bathyarchaeota archaeon]